MAMVNGAGANMTCGMVAIVSAPLWDSQRSKFAGLLTSSDYINVIQYYWQFPEAMKEIDQFRLDSLRGKQIPITLPVQAD